MQVNEDQASLLQTSAEGDDGDSDDDDPPPPYEGAKKRIYVKKVELLLNGTPLGKALLHLL
ncbi:MAG: hypothetical protein FJ333_11170 [Sphingomonadales bacterium]|nr:hypothetical protein [Sphingomonadales bacterium]